MKIKQFKLRDYDLFIEEYDKRHIFLFTPWSAEIEKEIIEALQRQGIAVNSWDTGVSVGVGVFNAEEQIGLIEIFNTPTFPYFSQLQIIPIDIEKLKSFIISLLTEKKLKTLAVSDAYKIIDLGWGLNELIEELEFLKEKVK